MSKKLAFFDVDKTIFDGYSGSGAFPFFESIGVLNKGATDWYRRIEERYTKGKISYKEIAYRVIERLARNFAELSHENVLGLMEEYLSRESLYPWVRPLVEELHSEGYYSILVSGTTQPFVDVIGKRIGVMEGYGSTIEMEGRVYTGRLLRMLDDAEKKKIVRECINKFNPEVVIAFGDSTGDLEMFSQANFVFVHEPHQTVMRAYAEARKNWHLVDRNSISTTVRRVLNGG